MLIITICVGSSCSIRGSDELASEIQRLMDKEGLDGLVDLAGAFCRDTCSKGVSIVIGDRAFDGIRPEGAEEFFYKEVMPYVNNDLFTKKP